jgi:uncharacterized protein
VDTSTPPPLAAPEGMACWDIACWDMACWARSAVFVAVLISSSLPFWLLLGSVQLNGFGLLPASALMVVCPMIAATVLAAVEGGRAQVATLWRRSVDVPAARYAGWVAAVALLPALVLLATLLDRGSVALPPAPVPLVAVPLLAVVYWRRRWPRRSAGPPP